MEPLTMMGSLPDSKLFSFPPAAAAVAVPPAPVPMSIMRPFNIPDNIYMGALDAKVPLTIAAAYAITAKLLNIYNRSNNKKPWAISKTRPFHIFVVLHNIFLAVYSAWTFWGMLSGMRRSVVSPFGPGGLAATADSLCRLQGPPGLGNAIFFDDATAGWTSLSTKGASALLAGNGNPSNTEAGRLWNEGLAYYGWIFYLSKFYEVLDTLIILAKGKFSSTLQTYHHAGAMMCMWAGMRYMSAPIWVFVLFNSFIHALMYTYYTLSAFSIKVPMGLKRSLTTMQITQFVVGASLAMVHSFIVYVMPVTVTRQTTGAAVDGVAAPTDSLIPNTAAAIDSLKQMIFGSAAAAAAANPAQESSVMTTETSYILQPCIASTSETYAIWINVLYLAPLTYLFVSFFIASYVKRSNAASKMNAISSRRMSNVTLAEKAGWDAARNVEREVYGGERMMITSRRSSGSGSAISDDERSVLKN